MDTIELSDAYGLDLAPFVERLLASPTFVAEKVADNGDGVDLEREALASLDNALNYKCNRMAYTSPRELHGTAEKLCRLFESDDPAPAAQEAA